MVLHAGQLRRQGNTDRARVDRAVGVAAGALVDWANIQASRATDALESLVTNRGGQGRGTAVIQQDQVEVLRAIALSNTGPHGGVWVHALRGGRTRQQLEEDLQVLEGRNQLFNAHHGN